MRNDNKINEMIKVEEYKEDLINPFDKSFMGRIDLKDTI